MKRFTVYVVSLVVAVLLSYGLGANAQKGKSTGTVLQQEAVFVPSPPQTYTVGCGQTVTLAHVEHWDNPSYPDTFAYSAAFRASGGPATISLVVTGGHGPDTSISLPSGSTEQSYKLEALKELVEDFPTDAQVVVTTPSCASEQVNAGSVVIKALNIHTTPLP